MKKYLLLAFLTPILFVVNAKPKIPKNVIIMVGDGMGLAQLCAAYAMNGKTLNIFEAAKIMGLSDTHSADDFITDSAAGATAFSCGVKTNNGMVGLKPDSTKVLTIFETVKLKKNMKTGLVVTCGITHATPACFYAHQPSRNLHKEIAKDLNPSAVDLAIGGDFPFFDTLNLSKKGYNVSVGFNENKELKSNSIVFYDTSSIFPKVTEGRYNYLKYASKSAVKALNNANGFMLLIEGSQIDWGGHANDSAYVITETLDFDDCFKSILEFVKKDNETLLIVTADHETGGLGLMNTNKKTNLPNLKFLNKHHSGIMVPVFAFGPGAEDFSGVYQNTEIYYKILKALEVK